MNKISKKQIINIALNYLIFILGLFAILVQFFGGGNNGVDFSKLDIFRFFTNDGNIFSFVISFIYATYILINKNKEIPKWLHICRLASAVNSLIIFFVVIFLLFPSFGISLFASYQMFVLHAFNPILIFITLLVFDRKKITYLESTLGSAPTLVYGIIVIALVFFKVWTKENHLIPYPFLEMYTNPWYMSVIYFIGILGGAVGLSVLCQFIINKIASKN